jgi:hypothetical protein
MDAHPSATSENTPEPEGNDIRRAPAGYLVRSGGVIVRAGTHLGGGGACRGRRCSAWSSGRTPSRCPGCRGGSGWRGGRGRGGGASEAQAGRSPGTRTGHGRRRAASNGGLKSLPPGWPCLVSWRATYGIGTRPRNSPNRIHRTASIGRGPDLWPAATGAGNRRPSWLTSDHYFEAELERLVCRQVIAGT